MHDIWNPWHGCTKVSEGCENCYMYSMDRDRGLDGSVVRRNASAFSYPIARRRDGSYRVASGELIRVCMTSDFFAPEADDWRDEAWDLIYQRPDVRFFILTKRPERMAEHLPRDWGDGWENVILNVTCENQRRADERIPILLATPARHRGIMCAPLIGPVDIEGALAQGDLPGRPRIEQVICGGENYEGARPCDFDWVRTLSAQCRAHEVTFAFIETGSVFVKDGRRYHLPSKAVQAQQAYRAGVSHRGRPITWRLRDPIGLPLPADAWHVPRYLPHCRACGSRLICNGCAACGQCGRAMGPLLTEEELEADGASS